MITRDEDAANDERRGSREARIEAAVRRRYAAAALAAAGGESAGCGCGCSDEASRLFGATLYGEAAVGLPAAAVRSSLGCANPHQGLDLAAGETALDLGSGGGADLLLAARRVGPEGRVYGLDMTPEMLELARANLAEAGVTNVELIEGRMEEIPLPDGSVDAVMSNCVINLSPDKARVLAEAFRVLRPGGRLAVADIVTHRPMPAEIAERVELWSACLGGALAIDDYRRLLDEAGFREVDIEVLRSYGLEEAGEERSTLERLFGAETVARADGLFASARVYGRKPTD